MNSPENKVKIILQHRVDYLQIVVRYRLQITWDYILGNVFLLRILCSTTVSNIDYKSEY